MFEQQPRARFQPVQHHGAEENGGLGAAGDAEGQGRNEGAAVLGVIGRFRRDHPLDVAPPVRHIGRSVALHLGGIAEKRSHRAADAGHGADEGADGRSYQHGRPVPEDRPDARRNALDLELGGGTSDGPALDREVDHLGNGERPLWVVSGLSSMAAFGPGSYVND